MKKKRKKIGFYKILLLCIALLLIVLVGGAVYLWGYFEAYEASRLENLIMEMQRNIDYDFWENEALSVMQARYTYFESGDTPFAPHVHRIRDALYILRENSSESTLDAPVYTLRAGARDIGTVRFSKASSVGHGLYEWEVDSIDFLESFIDGLDRSVSITVSQNAEVFLNDILVSQDYRVECDFEHGASYLIDGLFGDIDVIVKEFDGSVSQPEYASETNYIFLILVPYSQHFRVITPEGSSVFADGELVTDDKITASQITPAIFERFYRFDEAPVRLERYDFELDGLYAQPIIYATDAHGTVLPLRITEDGEYVFSVAPSAECKELFSLLAEEFIMAYFMLNANVGNNVNANFRAVADYVVRISALHTRLQYTYPRWTDAGSTEVTVNALVIDDFRPYGDGYFTCEIFFDVTVHDEQQTQDHMGGFEVLFIATNDGWLVLDMIAI